MFATVIAVVLSALLAQAARGSRLLAARGRGAVSAAWPSNRSAPASA